MMRTLHHASSTDVVLASLPNGRRNWGSAEARPGPARPTGGEPGTRSRPGPSGHGLTNRGAGWWAFEGALAYCSKVAR